MNKKIVSIIILACLLLNCFTLTACDSVSKKREEYYNVSKTIAEGEFSFDFKLHAYELDGDEGNLIAAYLDLMSGFEAYLKKRESLDSEGLASFMDLAKAFDKENRVFYGDYDVLSRKFVDKVNSIVDTFNNENEFDKAYLQSVTDLQGTLDKIKGIVDDLYEECKAWSEQLESQEDDNGAWEEQFYKVKIESAVLKNLIEVLKNHFDTYYEYHLGGYGSSDELEDFKEDMDRIIGTDIPELVEELNDLKNESGWWLGSAIRITCHDLSIRGSALYFARNHECFSHVLYSQKRSILDEYGTDYSMLEKLDRIYGIIFE